MPQPRRPSPRSKDRRSRSYSPRRRRSRSRSKSRDRSRSRSRERRRSPPRKRSPERSQRWSPRHRSQSSERDYPRQQVKHSGDVQSKRTTARRSRTPSPYSRGKKSKQEPSPYESRRRSPSPGPSRKSRPEQVSSSHSEHGSSARAPLFPSAGGTGKKREIDYVVIVNRGPKMEKLTKRFETLEQQAAGPFDIEENITIGIHRGPSNRVHLYDEEDIPVNYDFNTKTFKMLHPKKYYEKAIFDRVEVKAFHHDDILDEEAYVEKRTISVKPVDKPKSWREDRRDDRRDDIDFRITQRTDRDDPYGDRRMVRSHEQPRSHRYEDVPVTVRLDPKPDPRYERMYRQQQRLEDEPENIRDPGDLRNSLMRRKSEGGMMDARSRIEARRMEGGDVSPDRHSPDMDRKRSSSYKQDLPDFKNRPGKFQEDWENNPTATPKNFRYFLHDSRSHEDMNYWERKQMYLHTGQYPERGMRGRGFRGARGRGFVPRGRGRGRGFYRGGNKPGFLERRPYEGSADSWKHDKYDEDEFQEEAESRGKEPKEKGEKKIRRKEKKEKDGKKSGKKRHSDKEVKKEEDDLKHQERNEIIIS